MYEDFGHWGDADLMEPMERYSDDLMDFRNAELDEDAAAGEYEPDPEPDDVAGFEDDAYEADAE